MARASYLQRRNGRYHLQIRFTRALVSITERPLFRVSLRTSCYRQARRRLIECLAWIVPMNDSVSDYGSLLRLNAEDLRTFLSDPWPLSDARMTSRLIYEEMLRNLNRKAINSGIDSEREAPGYKALFEMFVRQNVEASAHIEQTKRDAAYERGRADMRQSLAAASVPSSFRQAGQALDIAQPDRGLPTHGTPGTARDITYSEALAEYLIDAEARGSKPIMRTDVRMIVEFLIAELGDRPVRSVSDDELKKLDRMIPEIPDRKNVPKSELVSLSRRYRYAQKHGWTDLKRLTEARLRNGYHTVCRSSSGG